MFMRSAGEIVISPASSEWTISGANLKVSIISFLRGSESLIRVAIVRFTAKVKRTA